MEPSSRFRRFGLLAPLLLALAAGCGKAKMTAPNEVIEPVSRVNELPWHLKANAPAQPPAEGEEPAADWFKELSVELEMLPGDAAGLKDAIDQRRGPAYQAGQALIKDVQSGVEGQRRNDALWSILSIQLGGSKAQRNGVPDLLIELGLTKLYARRPQIIFENVTLEQALQRLAEQGGLRLAPYRTLNPILNYEKDNVSVIEAIDGVLNVHGFDRRITGAYVQIRLRPEQFKSRQEFVENAVASVLNYGKGLDRNLAALIPLMRSREEEPKEKDKEKKAKDPAPGPAVPAPQPAEEPKP
ncbi:MAG: hypothetical protein KIS92_09375 [Planctomycetota bacterium]|nr:hypothetical protein [Planctomycetota bacterium]